jgi:uracil phosphoribosyltransferase
MSVRLCEVRHPLALDALASLRDRRTPAPVFAHALDRLGRVLAVTALMDLPLVSAAVQTPLAPAEVQRVAWDALVLVPVLRAGLGFVDAFRAFVPTARVAMVGVARDPQARAVPYLERVPELAPGQRVVVLDPMLATGGSACVALRAVAARGARAEDVTLVVAIATASGIEAVGRVLPGVRLVVAAIDPILDEHSYIVPGLGDAGDRLFGDWVPQDDREAVRG